MAVSVSMDNFLFLLIFFSLLESMVLYLKRKDDQQKLFDNPRSETFFKYYIVNNWDWWLINVNDDSSKSNLSTLSFSYLMPISSPRFLGRFSPNRIHVVVTHVSTLSSLVFRRHGERKLLSNCTDRAKREDVNNNRNHFV